MSTQSVKFWANQYTATAGKPAKFNCPACGDLGWLRPDRHPGDPEFGRLVRCDVCGKGRQRDWLYDGSGLTHSEQSLSLKDWKIPSASPTLRDQRRRAGRVIGQVVTAKCGLATFWGDFGSGKSMALRIIVNGCIQAGVESFYAPFALVLDHMRDMYNTKRKTDTFWERVQHVPVLALDEITRFYDTEWARNRLWILADTRYRYAPSHLTVLATNDDPRVSLPPDDTFAHLYSRMREGELVELRGDMRPAFK